MLENARADHRQQIVGDEIVVAVAGDAGCWPRGLKHGEPQENLRHDRQEPHQRAEREVAAIDEPLGQRRRRGSSTR